MTGRPERDIDGVGRSHVRLLATAAGIDDAIAGQPSLLPEWDVAMLVTHLARNADGLADVASRAVIDDLEVAIERLESTWAALPAEAWSAAGLSATGEPEPLAEAPRNRWREVEVHHADLGLAFTADDWDEVFVDLELERWMAGLERRLPPGAGALVLAADTGRSWLAGGPTVTMRVEAPSRRLLAWLIGRGAGDLPEIRPWDW